MSKDFSPILGGWQFQSGDVCARKIVGDDGREKLQVRLDLGLMQMEISGRPDGSRPKGCESILDYHLEQLAAHRKSSGSEEGFQLDEEACNDLWQEGVQYYQRYYCLLHMEDYEGVLRDTAHNLAVFDLVDTYCDDDEAKICFEQYRPYVLMIHARSKGEICLKSQDYEGALEVAKEGIQDIRAFFESFGDPELIESCEELHALEEWTEEIRRDRPIGLKQQLSRELREAVSHEQYEEAAHLRDRLRRLEEPKS